jgi:hypothetical protein
MQDPKRIFWSLGSRPFLEFWIPLIADGLNGYVGVDDALDAQEVAGVAAQILRPHRVYV